MKRLLKQQWFGVGRMTLLILPLFIGCSTARAQVDQAWLNQWNKANEFKPSKISSSGRIASENEPGIPLIIRGSVFNPDETPAAGVIVHAYHRDAQGYEFGGNDSQLNTWRLQGWVKTDVNGFFEFRTIKPAADHLGREGAHIHFTTVSERYGRQWAPKVFLADDPLITESQRIRSRMAGKYGWICELKASAGIPFIIANIRQKSTKDF